MINANEFWLGTALLAVATFLIRFAFFPAMELVRPSETIERILARIPSAVLAALALPAIVIGPGADGPSLLGPRVLPAMAAALVAWRTKNVPLTMIAGFAALWLQTRILG